MQVKKEKQLDLMRLSEGDRKELMDFYEFLLKKNRYKEKRDKSKLPDEFYQPVKRERYLAIKREEIYNNG
ncbi:MAG TPA: hypothetical protein VJL89_07945 [Thermodesulfovibrionia bacterium]|nr:hypothetical protein [Thermodesulfovibrionia bacterium]